MSKDPLYKQIKDKLLSDFKNLEYYSILPSERELCEKYNVSRPTIKSALKLIEEEGLIEKRERKGTFYLGNSPYIDHQLTSTLGFYSDAKLQGKEIKSKVLFQNIWKADEYIAKKLNINEGDEIFKLERQRYIDDKLFSLTTSYLLKKYAKYLMKEDFTNASLYKTLSNIDIIPYKGKQELVIIKADEYDAKHLNIKLNEPISLLKSTTYTIENEPIEYVEAKSNAYKTRYEMEVFHKK